MFTHSKDTDFLILYKLDYDNLYEIFQVNKYLSKISKDESIWKKLVWKDYNQIYPDKNQSWKELYLKIRYFIKVYGYRKDVNSYRASERNGHYEVRKYLATINKYDKNYKCEYVMQRGKYLGQRCDNEVFINYNKGSHRFCHICLRKTIFINFLKDK